jgi:hypothetical protein
VTDAGPADDATAFSTREKSPKSREKKRAVTFNDSVRVKTIEARKNTPRERLELFKRLGITLEGDGDEDDDDDDDDDNDDEDGDYGDDYDVDWDMERFPDVDSVEESMSVDSEDEDDDDDDDPDATESDPDLDSDTGVGVETIQRLKNDLFDDEPSESQDSGVFFLCRP